MTIAERINDQIKKNGMLKKDVCAAVGISPSTLSTWFAANAVSIPSEHVPALAKAFGISCDELLTGQHIERGEEDQLLDMYRALDWEGKHIVAAAVINEKRRLDEAASRARV